MLNGPDDKTVFVSIVRSIGLEGEKPRLTWVNKTKKGSAITFLTRDAILHVVALWNKKYPEQAINVAE